MGLQFISMYMLIFSLHFIFLTNFILFANYLASGKFATFFHRTKDVWKWEILAGFLPAEPAGPVLPVHQGLSGVHSHDEYVWHGQKSGLWFFLLRNPWNLKIGNQFYNWNLAFFSEINERFYRKSAWQSNFENSWIRA